MSIRKALRDLAAAVADEAAQNPQFERILGEILEPASSTNVLVEQRQPVGQRRDNQNLATVATVELQPCLTPWRSPRKVKMCFGPGSHHWTSNSFGT